MYLRMVIKRQGGLTATLSITKNNEWKNLKKMFLLTFKSLIELLLLAFGDFADVGLFVPLVAALSFAILAQPFNVTVTHFNLF